MRSTAMASTIIQIVAVEVYAAFKCLKTLKDANNFLVHQSLVHDGVNVDGSRLAVRREGRSVADSIESANPLLDFQRTPWNAVQNQYPRALKIEPLSHHLGGKQNLSFSTLECLQVLDSLVAETAEVVDRFCRHSLPNSGREQRHTPPQRSDHRQSCLNEIEEVINCQIVLGGYQHTLSRIPRPYLREEVH